MDVDESPRQTTNPTSSGRRSFFARAGAVLASLPMLGVRPGMAGDAGFGGGDNNADGGSPLTIARRGTFFAGGTVLTSPGVFDPTITGGPGQSLYGDHVYTQFEVPFRSRRVHSSCGTAVANQGHAGVPPPTAGKDTNQYSSVGASRCTSSTSLERDALAPAQSASLLLQLPATKTFSLPGGSVSGRTSIRTPNSRRARAIQRCR